MASVTIDSGPLSPTYRFRDIPKERWESLVRQKRNFLATNINYDCRCLIEFCEEAEAVWQDLGYESGADMIRNGYGLDPVEIELAVAWLRHNEPGTAISITDISAKVAEARAKPLLPDDVKEGRPPKGAERSVDNINTSKGGTGTDYTLRRLARDQPELLDEIQAGRLSVNAAAIKAGIRKKPTPEEICLKAFFKVEDKAGLIEKLSAMVGQ